MKNNNIYSSKFSSEFISVSQEEEYEKIYKIAIEKGDYDFLLKDDSFFQFSCELNNSNGKLTKLRYAYYQNPRAYPTYEEFLKDIFNTEIEQCGEIFQFEYEQMIAEAKINRGVCPIRYDYDYELYQGMYHSISHIHIGHNNEVRIAVNKMLTPEKFALFVLRNIYYDVWMECYKNNVKFQQRCLTSKQRCEALVEEYFSKEENKQLFLS